MSLDDKKENIEWRKCEFEGELENAYEFEIQNFMTCMHKKKVNKQAEWNLLHDILNPLKRTKIANIYNYPILHGYMNTQKGKAKIKKFLILLNIGCSSTIIMERLIPKKNPKKDNVIQCTHKPVKLIPIWRLR